VKTCNANNALRQCFSRVKGCTQLALCWMSAICPPRGTAGCATTAQCYAVCGNNDDCICSCTKRASANVGGLLRQIISCAFDCRGNSACVQQRCPTQLQQCALM